MFQTDAACTFLGTKHTSILILCLMLVLTTGRLLFEISGILRNRKYKDFILSDICRRGLGQRKPRSFRALYVAACFGKTHYVRLSFVNLNLNFLYLHMIVTCFVQIYGPHIA